jgi:hypothetical protein
MLLLKQRNGCYAFVVDDDSPGDEAVDRQKYSGDATKREDNNFAGQRNRVEFAENQQAGRQAKQDRKDGQFSAYPAQNHGFELEADCVAFGITCLGHA